MGHFSHLRKMVNVILNVKYSCTISTWAWCLPVSSSTFCYPLAVWIGPSSGFTEGMPWAVSIYPCWHKRWGPEKWGHKCLGSQQTSGLGLAGEQRSSDSSRIKDRWLSEQNTALWVVRSCWNSGCKGRTSSGLLPWGASPLSAVLLCSFFFHLFEDIDLRFRSHVPGSLGFVEMNREECVQISPVRALRNDCERHTCPVALELRWEFCLFYSQSHHTDGFRLASTLHTHAMADPCSSRKQ